MELIDNIMDYAGKVLARMNYPRTPEDQVDLPGPSDLQLREYFQNHKLASVLPYGYYDQDTRVFHNSDSFGFMLDCTPILGASEETARIVSSLFSLAWPEGACLQVSLWASPNPTHLLREWAYNRTNQGANGIHQEMAARRIAYLRKGLRQSVLKSSHMMVRDFQLFITVTFPGKSDDLALRRMLALRESIISTLQSAGIGAYSADANTFVGLLDEILNPRQAPREELPPWDPTRLLRDQVVEGSTRLLIDRDGMLINDTALRSLSVRSYPGEFTLTQMGQLIGDEFQASLTIPCPFLFTLGVCFQDQEALKPKMELKAARSINYAEKPLAKYVPQLQQRAQDWRLVQDLMGRGKTLLRAYHSLILLPVAGEGESAEQTTKSLFSSKSWTLQSDRYTQLVGLLSALPLSLSKGLARELEAAGRLRWLTQDNVANLMPIIGEWKGTGTPVMMLLGRRGQLQFLDVFEDMRDNTNYNIAIAATSGAGKSFVLQELVLGYIATGGRAWIIDVGRSYESLCKILGGQFIEFTDKAAININPFTSIQAMEGEDSEMPMLKSIFAQMAAPSRPLDDWSMNVMEEAIKHAWETKKNDATVTDVANWLRAKDDQRVQDLGQMLYSYTRDGVYAQYFEGPANIKFEADLCVLELEELKSRRDLQTVVLLIVMLKINQAMFLGDRSRRSLCVIDEAWDLFGDGHSTAAKFIETGYRRARKANGSFATATQGVADYYKNEASRAAFENAGWMLLLRQNKESIDQLEESKKLSLDPYMKRMLNSIRTESGAGGYSEILIKGGGGYAVSRLVVDPFSAMLFSTKPKEFKRVRELQGQGLTLVQAVETLVHEVAKKH